ncbi:DUF6172 family protein [Variovorax sp. HJSM1_2]|uniref:DUF6172 family protein n=1 Tax=Variovorax sp. HJSM1_2 TaxID=3366263 RepID=UPI003BE8C682
MRKTFQLRPEGKNPDRVLDAVKNEVRKYLKRERRHELPEGSDYWDFDCRSGADAGSAVSVHVAELIGALDAAFQEGASQHYLEILARPAKRRPRDPAAGGVLANSLDDSDDAED